MANVCLGIYLYVRQICWPVYIIRLVNLTVENEWSAVLSKIETWFTWFQRVLLICPLHHVKADKILSNLDRITRVQSQAHCYSLSEGFLSLVK